MTFSTNQDSPPSWWFDLPSTLEEECAGCRDYEIALDDVRGCFDRLVGHIYGSGTIDKESMLDELGDMAIILSVHLPRGQPAIERAGEVTEGDLVDFNQAMRNLLT